MLSSGVLRVDVEQYAELTLSVVLSGFVHPGPERSFEKPMEEPQVGILIEALLQTGEPVLHMICPFEQDGIAFGRAQNWEICPVQLGLPLHGSITTQTSPFLQVAEPH